MSTLKDRVQQVTAAAEPDSDQQPETLDMVAGDTAFQWLERRRRRLELTLPAHLDAGHVIEAARHSMEQLRDCTPQSIDTALMACARFGLAPDGVHAALIPFGKVATFVPMYRGLISVMHRSGMVQSVRAGLIRERDAWAYEESAPPPDDFFFKPRVDLSTEERGPVVLAYAFAWLKGGARSQVVLLNRQDAVEIRDLHSKAFANAERNKRKNSPWHTDFDAQWRKSAIRRLPHYVPTSPEMVDLLRADMDADAGRPAFIPGEFWETTPEAAGTDAGGAQPGGEHDEQSDQDGAAE